jgi:hypothetical protein
VARPLQVLELIGDMKGAMKVIKGQNKTITSHVDAHCEEIPLCREKTLTN